MICIEKEQVTEKKWRVDLQADTNIKDPVDGSDVDDLRDDIEFYAGSTLTILSPSLFKVLGEDGVWHVQSSSGSGSGGGSGTGGTYNYNDLNNKPQINGVALVGNKTTAELGISGLETINEIKIGEMKAVTSNAVAIGVGNIEVLLNTI